MKTKMRADGVWRMKEPCEDCPFNSRGPGLKLRRSLRPGRWKEILAGLRNDRHFTCHKTRRETGGDGSDLLCAGSIQWQEKRGLSSQLQRILERLDYYFPKQKKAKT